MGSSTAESSREQIDLEGDLEDQKQMGGDSPVALGLQIGAPVLGMVFQSGDQAYEFYNAYARSLGFSIRKKRTYYSPKDRKLMRLELCCSKEGAREAHARGEPKKPQAHTRSGCEACLFLHFQDGNYVVYAFKEEHNHELAKQSEVHMLRSHRKIMNSHAGLINNMHTTRIASTRIFSCMRVEAGGFENLNFTRKDCANYVQRKRCDVLKKGDARILMRYFMQMQANNPSFFYSVDMDEDNQLASCFWCDAKSKIDYSFFGDVLCFDTTYKMNGYDKPYVSFVGVNHHNQSIFFGSALLYDESTETFVWLFNTFLKAMNGKKPKTIFTDQAPAIVNAVRQVLPNTHNRLCLWHIYQNATMHLSHVFDKFTSFATDFKKCIYGNDTLEEFQSDWKMLLEKYNLIGNEWLERLYQVREKWALVYGREHFCAGMISIQRSESMNKYLKKYFKINLSLEEFVHRYEDAVKDRRDQEAFEDFNSRQTTPFLVSKWALEEQASKIYTRTIFRMFQEQVKECFGLFQELVGEEGTLFTYEVTSHRDMGGRIVTFDSSDNTVKCSCKIFEFTGILCSHALKIVHIRQLLEMPSQYFLHRWTKDATSGVVVDEGKLIEVDCKPSLTSRYNELSQIALTLVEKGATTESSCSLAKRKLMQVLREIDFSLQVQACRQRQA